MTSSKQQPHTPTTKEVKAAAESDSPYGYLEPGQFERWLADHDVLIRAEEREHVNQQIQNRLYDWDPDYREDGYLLTPATVTIRASDLNDIISGGDSNIRFSFTDEEWDKHISEVAAAAEQRGVARTFKESANEVRREMRWQYEQNINRNSDAGDSIDRLLELEKVFKYRADQEGDE